MSRLDPVDEMREMRNVLQSVREYLGDGEYAKAGEEVNKLEELAHCPLCEQVSKQMNTGVLYVLNSPEGRRPIIAEQVANEAGHYVTRLDSELDPGA